MAAANIITTKNLIPTDRPADWDRPGGLRIGTTEVTRWGMREPELERIADLIVDILHGRITTNGARQEAIDLRRSFPAPDC